MPPSTQPSTSSFTPAVWISLGGLVVSLVLNVVTCSFYFGKLDNRVGTLESKESKREARQLEEVYEYEKAKAAKYAEMEQQINRLKNMPAPK